MRSSGSARSDKRGDDGATANCPNCPNRDHAAHPGSDRGAHARCATANTAGPAECGDAYARSDYFTANCFA